MADGFKERHGKLIHTGFTIGLVIKGIDGLLEIIGGVLLIYFNPGRLSRLIKFMTQGELLEDPNDIFANILLKISSSFSIDAFSFGIFYLISHGLVKCFIIYLLWRRKLWAYPFSLAVLVLFIFYQIYRYTLNASVWMILLTASDILMIILTWLEYQRVKAVLPAGK
jgi:uncharacterized membrane protein